MGAEIQWCSCRDARPCVSTNEYCGCWQIQGKHLHASELTIDCTRSGQFASALWLISEKIGLKKLHVLPENPSSAAYIAMTEAIMEGKADMDAKRLGDWSAAVYWYARLLLEGQRSGTRGAHPSVGTTSCDAPVSYKLLHLDLQSLQSDAIIAQWFSQWGIVSRQEEDGVVIGFKEIADYQKSKIVSDNENDYQNEESKLDKTDFQGDVIELDMSQNLDLVPVLACMACLWPKKMFFNGVANLKYKESNRLQIIQEQLSPFAKIEIKSYSGIPDNQLIISPIDTHNSYSVPSQEFSFNAHNDHRFVMGFSLFALRGKVQIKDFDCVRKSYPDFKAEGVVAGTDMLG
jgi:5-enolpyruvylshikimate-3-phosphate synthase